MKKNKSIYSLINKDEFVKDYIKKTKNKIKNRDVIHSLETVGPCDVLDYKELETLFYNHFKKKATKNKPIYYVGNTNTDFDIIFGNTAIDIKSRRRASKVKSFQMINASPSILKCKNSMDKCKIICETYNKRLQKQSNAYDVELENSEDIILIQDEFKVKIFSVPLKPLDWTQIKPASIIELPEDKENKKRLRFEINDRIYDYEYSISTLMYTLKSSDMIDSFKLPYNINDIG